MNMLFIDLEYESRSREQPAKLLSIGYAVFNDKGELLKSDNIYFKLRKGTWITSRVRELTGITKELLAREGVELGEGLSQVEDVMNEYKVKRVFSYGHNDRPTIRECGKFKFKFINRITDMSLYVQEQLGITESVNLQLLGEFLDIKVGKAHNSETDAIMCGYVYNRVQYCVDVDALLDVVNGVRLQKFKERLISTYLTKKGKLRQIWKGEPIIVENDADVFEYRVNGGSTTINATVKEVNHTLTISSDTLLLNDIEILVEHLDTELATLLWDISRKRFEICVSVETHEEYAVFDPYLGAYQVFCD